MEFKIDFFALQSRECLPNWFWLQTGVKLIIDSASDERLRSHNGTAIEQSVPLKPLEPLKSSEERSERNSEATLENVVRDLNQTNGGFASEALIFGLSRTHENTHGLRGLVKALVLGTGDRFVQIFYKQYPIKGYHNNRLDIPSHSIVSPLAEPSLTINWNLRFSEEDILSLNSHLITNWKDSKSGWLLI